MASISKSVQVLKSGDEATWTFLFPLLVANEYQVLSTRSSDGSAKSLSTATGGGAVPVVGPLLLGCERAGWTWKKASTAALQQRRCIMANKERNLG